jgi:hypothetical protein
MLAIMRVILLTYLLQLCHSLRIPLRMTSSSITTLQTTFNGNTIPSLKFQILQLGASLDRGQSYNPTSGDYYADRMLIAKQKIKDLILTKPQQNTPVNLQQLHGEWELILSTVPHGIFRSSPFFLAIQSAYASVGQIEKAELFFKLHELQTCSWGISKIGRVAQYINTTDSTLTSEFDTSIFSLTTIPILGWWKLLPTFGGCVVTVSKMKLDDEGGIDLEVDYTTSKPVDGLQGLGEAVWGQKVPVGSVWKLLPWNKGNPPTCKIRTRYLDEDFRIVEDISGEYFVYTRPVCPRI